MMRCLRRNQHRFHYAVFVEQHPIEETDEYGNRICTGEYAATYSEPILAHANISPANGVVTAYLFGTMEKYDKTLVMDVPDVPIDEHTVLWLDTEPDSEGKTPYDYIVKRVARGLNSVVIAASRVNVQYE